MWSIYGTPCKDPHVTSRLSMTRTWPRPWEAHADHGLLEALRIAEADGPRVAQAWFAAHEQLPPHGGPECQVRSPERVRMARRRAERAA